MKALYPKSLLTLLLIGFALATLPLVMALGNVALYLDRLAEQSQQTLTQAVKATRASRTLLEELTLMERSARQYFVLNDALLLENYARSHANFERTLAELRDLTVDARQRQRIDALARDERALHGRIARLMPDPVSQELAVAAFMQLSAEAQTILNENNRLIDRESERLANAARRAQQGLFWQIMMLLPVALLVAMVITFLVAQPIRRMDDAIKKLGAGRYDEAIDIDGPGDIRQLGQRLNWLRDELREVEAQKQRFLRHVSHEFKTPLTAIREGSELLAEEVGGRLSPQQHEIVGILRESSLRLQRMIENLLSYSAVQMQKLQLSPEAVDLSALAREVIRNYALTLQSKQISIVHDDRPLPWHGDREKLQTILDNLLSNAIKYTPAGGDIRVHMAKQPEQVVIDIEDSGPGIAPDEFDDLFTPFYRGSGPYQSHVGGSGLGLSIAKEYAEAHGGTLTCLPGAPGAHFRITLPLEMAPT